MDSICLTVLTTCVIIYMIKSISCKETKKIYGMEGSRKLPVNIQQRAYKKLLMINNAATIDDLRIPPSNYLEKLSGSKEGQYSIRINDQWRICFCWNANDEYEVAIVDYH